MDSGPRAAVAGLGHKGVRSAGGGRGSFPRPGRQGPLQAVKGGHDAPYV